MKRLLVLFAFSACTDEPALLDEIEANADVPADDSIDAWMAEYCPGIASGVETYDGLSGTYVRLGVASAGEPVRLSLLAVRDDGDAEGTFSGTRASESGFPAVYAGRFRALADNPAIGAVVALDVGSDGEYDQTLFTLGLRRSLGRVRALCLVGAANPFMLVRLY